MEELYDIAALQLTSDDYPALRINAVDLKYRLVSRPIVVIACMLGSSELWGP